MMKGYVVFKKGVYIQSIISVVDNLETAVRIASRFADNEPDDCHDIVVADTIKVGGIERNIVIALPKSGWAEYVNTPPHKPPVSAEHEQLEGPRDSEASHPGRVR